MVDRIRKLLATEQMSPSQFADEINLQRSSLSHVLSGRNKPSLDFVMKIKQRFSEVNIEWLIFGSGNMYVSKDESAVDQVNKPISEQSNEETQQKINFDSQQIAISSVEKIVDTEKSSSKIEQPDIKATSGKADRVIIFYNNGTFEEYTKSKG